MRVLAVIAALLCSMTMFGQCPSTASAYPDNVASGLTPAQIIARISNPSAPITAAETAVRQQVVAMYLSVGIDPSFDYANDWSTALQALSPTQFRPGKQTSNLAMSFSPDAPYYQAIPAESKVLLPAGFFGDVQVNSTRGPDSDGIGYGEITASAKDAQLIITSEWYTDKTTLVTTPYRMPSTWSKSLPTLPAGDSHMIYVDTVAGTFVSSYKTTLNTKTKGPQALYASTPIPLTGMGDSGGSTAAKFAELPVLIQPGELTAATPIAHAIGGSIQRVWGGRVYPASARDSGMLTSVNTCTNTGFMDTGLVPYGGVIQLDPALDLTKIKLTLPALRILQAMQTYGYYVMDFGCTDLDIYSAIDETEIEPYGGMYGNAHGSGVQNEVKAVLLTSKLYVVPPMVKH